MQNSAPRKRFLALEAMALINGRWEPATNLGPEGTTHIGWPCGGAPTRSIKYGTAEYCPQLFLYVIELHEPVTFDCVLGLTAAINKAISSDDVLQ